MATVYSLICWGGKGGKSVTVNATTDLVTLTNHGLRNSKGVQFVSGTLPTVSGTALAMNTDYYAKWISTSTFELYYESSLTTKINFTSTGSSLVLKGSYYQGLTDKSRWTYGGTEYIFDGRVAWNTDRTSGTSPATVFDTEVAELGDDYDDLVGASWSCTIPAAAVEMTSMVNGVRGNGWHGGVVGAGYVAAVPNGGYTALSSGNIQDFTFDGFSAQAQSTSTNGNALTTSTRGGNVVKNMIISGVSTSFGLGLNLNGAMTKVQECLIVGLLRGLVTGSFTYGALFANNTVVGNGTGIYAESSGASTYGKYYNNTVYGNTTNWSRAAPAAVEGATKNTGQSGDAIAAWAVGAGSSSVTVTSSDFANYAGGDYRPASSSSLLYDAGSDYYGRLAFDLGDNEVPNYNNGGSEGIDIGCFEFNNGYGNHPSSDYYGLEFTGLIAGSKVKVFTTGTDTELFSDTNSSTTETWSVNSSSTAVVDYTIQKAGYYPIRVTGVTVTGGPDGILATPIQQVIDRAYVASSGLTINTNVFANASTKKFGLTTASTGQNFYSYMIEQWIALGDTGEAYANKQFPLVTNGPNSITCLDGWEFDLTTYSASITNLSRDGLRYVNSSGTMTATWAALLSAGVPSGEQVRYEQTDGGTVQSAAATGNIDQLIQVYGDALHGNFDYRGYLVCKVQGDGLDQAEVDVIGQYGNLEDQLYVIALAPASNGIAAGTVTGITITDHGASPVTWNGKAYSITITDTGTHTGEEIVQYVRGLNDFDYHDLVQTNGTAFKTVRGKVYGDAGATLKGVRVVQSDGTTSHADFNLHTADDGTTYIPPLPPAAAESTVLADSRVQLFNVTTDTEIDNVFVTGTSYSYVITTEASAGDALRLRVCKLGREPAESLAVWGAAGATFLISQPEDAIYTAWGIDGSAITEFTGDVTGHIYIDANDLDGMTTKTRLGAWYSWVLTTEIGIRHFYGGVSYLSTAAIRINTDVADILIENVNASTALRFTDMDVRLYRSDGTSIIAPTSYSIHNDYSGVPDVVETGVSGLTTAESNVLMGLPGTVSTIEKITRNKMITDPATGVLTVYDDDGATPLMTANIFKDAAGTVPYNGTGAERRERLA